MMDHGKRAVSTFPIATGEYYKWDYSAGVDISRYKNIKVPTSYMAAHSNFDFIGNYDERREAGLLHVADHHIAPGKKQWTWGSGDFGKMWDQNLTETDGPYIELMTGVYTDNQPDFTWLKPQEEKTFVQYFMPYKGIGRVGNATRDAAVSLSRVDSQLMELRVYATGRYPDARIVIFRKDSEWLRFSRDLDLEQCVRETFDAPGEDADYRVEILGNGKTLVTYTPFVPEETPVPNPADPIPAPEQIPTTEKLCLAAQHLEQYRHATREPADYYLEGLSRDATDVRLNNGYGLLLLRRGRISESIPYFEAAVKKQTRHNPNPYTGDVCFNLGLALDSSGQSDAAYDAFYKATWSAETKGAAFYHLACLESRRENYDTALQFTENSLIQNAHSNKTRVLKSAMLRHLGLPAAEFLRESMSIDPLNLGCLYEQSAQDGDREKWVGTMRSEAHNYLSLSLDYMQSGLYPEALDILQSSPEQNPLCLYY